MTDRQWTWFSGWFAGAVAGMAFCGVLLAIAMGPAWSTVISVTAALVIQLLAWPGRWPTQPPP